MSQKTTHETLQVLSKSILNKLENRKFIEFNPSERNELQQALFSKLTKWVLTDADLTEKVRQTVAGKSEAIADGNFTETEAFQSQKRALKTQLGENELHGLYFQVPVREVVMKVGKFLFDTPLVEEVFESDEAIHKLVLETIQTFDESKP